MRLLGMLLASAVGLMGQVDPEYVIPKENPFMAGGFEARRAVVHGTVRRMSWAERGGRPGRGSGAA